VRVRVCVVYSVPNVCVRTIDFVISLLVSSAAGNDPISAKSSLSSMGGILGSNNELTSVGANDVFSSEDEALLIGDCKSLYTCICHV